MSRTAVTICEPSGAGDEVLSWALGLGITLALFSGLARIEVTAPAPPEVEDLHLVSLPVDLPLVPRQTVETQPPEEALPLLGVDAGATDSPVHLRAVPPEFRALLPQAPLAPKQLGTLGRVPDGLRPRVEADEVAGHIYQESEVDQLPRAIVRTVPLVPEDLFGKSAALRVVLLITISQMGEVENIRIAQPSGQPIYDRLVAEYVRHSWQFSPAIRRGQPVRCLAEQRVTMLRPGAANPFNTR